MTRKPNLVRIDKVARLLDSKFRIPGTQIRFGLDSIIGLIPGLGDLASMIISSGLIVFMIKEGASGKVVAKMLGNIILDTTVGEIPLLGDLFDLFYKSNTRNVQLMHEHFHEGKHQGSAWGILGVIFVAFLLIFALVIFASINIFKIIMGHL